MRYLITGHTGFKGAWLAAMLKAQGHNVVGISLPALDKSLYKEAVLSELFSEEYFLDIRNHDEFKQAVLLADVEVAFHLAAQPLVLESYMTPIKTFETNVIGTLNFLGAIRETSIKAAVVITTDKVYKNKNLLRGYTESDELGGHDPYSSSKAAADIATQSWVASFGCKNIAIARAGNVIGGGDWAVDRLMPDLVSAFVSRNPANIRYPDSIRPWQHVADCLAGYLALSEKMLASGVVGEWNFGPALDTELKVSKVADLAAQAWGDGASWEVDREPHRHEAGYLLLDSAKARQELNWQDKLDLESTIRWTMEFYKSVVSGASSRTLLEQQVEAFFSL
jgi:CDP-glucose 4,6-dehydratase